MMNQELITTLKTSISKVLETMFFLPVTLVAEPSGLNRWLGQVPQLWGATLGFKGPASAFAYMLLPEQVLKEMTANMLGLDQESVNEGQQTDTLKEALNMIAGHMLSLYDEKAEFKLGIPEIMDVARHVNNAFEDLGQDAILIETEESRMAAGIVIEVEA